MEKLTRNNPVATPDNILFDLELPIEEDVDACLTHFVFLSRLGLPKALQAARHLADTVLWRHLYFFPVFAELGFFFVYTDDQESARDLLVASDRMQAPFMEHDQRAFVQTLMLFTMGRLAMMTISTLKGRGPAEKRPDEEKWWDSWDPTLVNINYQSPAQLQAIEMCLWDVVNRRISRDSQNAGDGVRDDDDHDYAVIKFVMTHFYELVELEMVCEATELFFIACILASSRQWTDNYLLKVWKRLPNLYWYLHKEIISKMSQASTTDDLKDSMLMQLRLQSAIKLASCTAAGRGLFGQHASNPTAFDTLDRDVERCIGELCSMLDIAAHPENRVAYLIRNWTSYPLATPADPLVMSTTDTSIGSANLRPQEATPIVKTPDAIPRRHFEELHITDRVNLIQGTPSAAVARREPGLEISSDLEDEPSIPPLPRRSTPYSLSESPRPQYDRRPSSNINASNAIPSRQFKRLHITEAADTISGRTSENAAQAAADTSVMVFDKIVIDGDAQVVQGDQYAMQMPQQGYAQRESYHQALPDYGGPEDYYRDYHRA